MFRYSKQNEDHNLTKYEIKLKKDEILSLSKNDKSFIPIQQTFQNKVALTTTNQPVDAGFYNVLRKSEVLK